MILVAAGPFISLLPAATPSAVPSAFIFVMVFVADALGSQKPQKNKEKVCKLRTSRPAVKKQGQDKSR